MASIKQSSVFNFPQNGGLGFPLPLSDLQFSWRNDPGVKPSRKHVTEAIQAYLAQNASGEFGRQIAELATYLENQMFMGALSKEDYMDTQKFHVRLQVLIQRKWIEAQSAQRESVHSSTLPMYGATPTFGALSNFGRIQSQPLPDYVMAANAGSNMAQAYTLNPPHPQADVLRTALSGLRKRTFNVTSQPPEQLIPNHCSPGEGLSSGGPADSGPTFSGSVLQYDSEASFESHNITQRFTEGERSLIVSSSQSSPSAHTPSMLGENLKSEVLNVSDEVIVQHPVLEPPRLRQQQQQLKMQLNRHLLGKGDASARISVQNKNLSESYEALSRPLPFSCFDGSTFGNASQIPADKLLFCYITYIKQHPLLRERSKVCFLKYLHSQKCSPGMCDCEKYNLLLAHFDDCGSDDCRICGPAIRACSAGLVHLGLDSASNPHRSMTCATKCASEPCLESSEDFMNPAKIRKLNSSLRIHDSPCAASALVENSTGQQPLGSPVEVYLDAKEGHTKLCKSDAINFASNGEDCNNTVDNIEGEPSDDMPIQCGEAAAELKPIIEPAIPCELNDKATDSFQMLPSDCGSEQKCADQLEDVVTGNFPEETRAEISGEGLQPTVAKSEKQKVDGLTLTDFFTPEEIRQHIASLSQKGDEIVAEEVMGNTASCSFSENCCQICASDRLAFAPMPIYCSACGMRIKSYGTYYSPKDENRAQICFCSACHNKARGGCITFCGVPIPKNNLLSKKNDLVSEESWVQCDRCEGWQHQICALFNDKRDLGGKAEYVCPKCYLEDLDREMRIPLPRSSAFDARNLPQTLLSNHIEQRLFKRLKQEREDRAKAAGKTVDEVPEPSDLVVRVVSSVDKRLKVKEQFLNIFPERNYPAEFPYRSKVILLFQRIEGVDVCLFAMYVQEFGSECSPPNQRCIYISYLDSVKYFRPEIKAVSGEALRTFVYHEILVGYLDYCKRRGFATCYIWACPPVKGEDYILYCHPETQKTPRPDKLRHWYQSMLKKASKEQIVVNFTNLYEKFFVPNGECNTKVTAARLPYFDGDYWSSVAESMIKKIEQEDLDLKVKKMTRRSLKSMGHVNPSADEVKDILLMQELGQSISTAKEDFIIVYLQFVCTHCHEVILSGKRWFCNQCKNFQLCERCHDGGQNSALGDTHISSSGQKHALTQEIVNDVPVNTEDNDAIMDNCFLENRHALLSFCQGNHYQFDSPRRAKHSSMMILYHLHNPNGSSSGTLCSLCLKDLGADQRWKCDLCPELNVCGMCYQRSDGFCHNHKMTCHSPTPTCGAENKLTKMVRELLDVIRHASRCQTASYSCPYPNCNLVRRLFSHAHTCKIRVAGGCRYCRKTWFVLMMHSRRCKDSDCVVPRCMDLKKYAENIESQSKTERSNNPLDVHLH